MNLAQNQLVWGLERSPIGKSDILDFDTVSNYAERVEDDVGKMLVEDVVVTLVVVAGNDKRWQDFSSAVDWEGFLDWQEFSAATGRELQSSVGMLILLALVLEWLGVFFVRGLLIFLFVVTLVNVLFEVVAAAAAAAALGAAAPIERDAQADC